MLDLNVNTFPPEDVCNSLWSFFTSNLIITRSRPDGAYGVFSRPGMNLKHSNGLPSATCMGACASRNVQTICGVNPGTNIFPMCFAPPPAIVVLCSGSHADPVQKYAPTRSLTASILGSGAGATSGFGSVA